jgi:hypothetical protein
MTISVNVYRNPLAPECREQRGVQCPVTLRDLTIEENGGASEWPFPTIAIVDGVPWKRGRWNEPLTDGMVVEFRSMVRGGGSSPNFVIGGLMIAAGAVAIATGAGIPLGVGLIAGGAGMMYAGYKIRGMPGTPSSTSALQGESGSPTYAINGSNRSRLNEPVPVIYGTIKTRPDFASLPYTYYANEKDQFLKATLAIGWGEFDTITKDNLYFGSAASYSFDDVSLDVYGTTENPSAFREVVTISDAINGRDCPGVIGAESEYITNGTAYFYPAGYVIYLAGSPYYTFVYDTITSGPVVPDSLLYIRVDGPVVFSGAVVGDVVNVSGTTSNNGDHTITGIGAYWLAGKWIEVNGSTLTYEADTSCTIKGETQGWSSPVKICDPQDVCDTIEWDIQFSGGLGTVAGDGSVSNKSVTIELLIEDQDGVELYTESNTVTAANVKQPYRATFSKYVPGGISPGSGIFCRLRRTTLESASTAVVDKAVWAGLKAFLTDDPDYAGLTKIQINVKASEQLSGDISNDIGVIVTRKLPVWNGSTWSAPTATRSIAWALADICKNTDYGMGLDDSLIDLDALLALDTIWTARGDYFDGIFDQTITAWEALQKVARVGRAITVLVGGRVTFVRDGEKTIRSAIFNPSNIAPGSLTIQYAFRQDSEPDGIELTYISPSTWTEETVTVALPGLVGDPVRPEKVDLFGCTNLDQATREATYLARRMAYMRKTITWQTEMDGRLLMVGDMVAIAHDVPSWSQSGEVIGFTDNGATCDYLTSQALDWTAAGTKYALLKKRDGSVSGPHAATEITGGFRINDPAFVPDTTLEDGERTSFVFYAGTSQDVIITDISPAGDTTATITAVPYDARIHASGA